MARHKQLTRFVPLTHVMMKSTAWRHARPVEKAVLLDLWMRYNGNNNGQIVYAARDGEKIGISKSVTARALAGLIELGFLRIARDAAFTVKTKEAREWILTAEPFNGRAATKDFMRWQPPRKQTPSHQKSKNETRSPEREKRSPKGHRKGKCSMAIPHTVPLGGLESAFPASTWSPARDTSSLPSTGAVKHDSRSSVAGVNGVRGAPRFGDAAKAQRTERPTKPLRSSLIRTDDQPEQLDLVELLKASEKKGRAQAPDADSDKAPDIGKVEGTGLPMRIFASSGERIKSADPTPASKKTKR